MKEKITLPTDRDLSCKDVVDRIVLRRPECERLDRWLSQLNARFDGMIRLTKSDLANFIIRLHADELSDTEVTLIESEFYDEVRWLNWALAKIRKAKKEGVSISLEQLMLSRSTVANESKPAGKTSRKPRVVRADNESSPIESSKP